MKAIIREILGLFFDDGAFALAILCWLALVDGLAHFLPTLPLGLLLFVGLASILLSGVVRFARRRTR